MSFHEAFARLRIAPNSSFTSGVLQSSRSSQPARCNPTSLTSVRHATHGKQGRANGPKNGPGKRLGAKKTGEQYVIPGNIIYRQRGTLWFPGENVGMGRDHTIFSLQTGYVKYYKDPLRHPKRKYIGVVFDREQSLPTPLNAARRRRLSMVAVPRDDAPSTGSEISTLTDVAAQTVAEELESGSKLGPAQQKAARRLRASGRLPSEQLELRPDYSYRESNYDIGRAAERAGVPPTYYKPNNRFVAWRKRTVRKTAAAEKRSMARKGGSKKKK